MALPKRKYYSLKKAAEKLKKDGLDCDESDLLHFATNGNLEICARLETADAYSGAQLAIPPQWIMEAENNVHRWGEKQESAFVTFIKAKDYSGYMRLVRYGECLVVAETFDCLFAIVSPAFSDLEFGYQDVISIGNSYISLPRGSEYSSLLKDGEGRELDHTLGAGEGANSFFIMDIQRPIPLSNLVITAKELELLISGGRQIDLPSEPPGKVKISPKAASADSNIIGALFSELLSEINKGSEKISQTTLIGNLAGKYTGYSGLSESSLGRKIPAAIKGLEFKPE